MSRNGECVGRSWLDILLLLAFLVPAAWMSMFDEIDAEKALGLFSTGWIHVLDEHMLNLRREQAAQEGQRATTVREYYSQTHPRSPLAAINRRPAIASFWSFCKRCHETALPFLTILSPGVGLITMRRSCRRRCRARWGAGRVAAAFAAVFCSVSIVEQFVLRRCGLMWYAEYRDTLLHSWQVNGQQVGIAIASAWLFLLVAGRWRARPGWREWLGLALGSAWLVNLFWATVLEPLAQFGIA